MGVLAGAKRVTLSVEENSDSIFLPVVGAITVKDGTGDVAGVEAGRFWLTLVQKEQRLN